MESAGENPLGRSVRAGRRLKIKTLEQSVADARRETILNALRKTGWNRSEAARLLGISRSTLYRTISHHFLPGELSDMERHRSHP